MPLPRFLNQLDILKTLYNSNPIKLEYILQHIDENVIRSIAEIALNILKGVVSLSPHRFKGLKKYSTYIKQLARKTTSLRRKQQILSEHPDLVNQILGALFAKLMGSSQYEQPQKTSSHKS